jgi:phosphate-selective porin OprO and OprP
MTPHTALTKNSRIVLVAALLCLATSTQAADQALLDILLENGAITAEQHRSLLEKETLTSEDIIEPASAQTESTDTASDDAVSAEIARQIEEASPVQASYGGAGFRLETRDGNSQMNLQWRSQLRYSSPINSDPRSLPAFNSVDKSNFEARRLRMKIAGHGFQPWLQYSFELDLQPSRDVDDSSSSASARVIDWSATLAKWDWGGIRVGQWKVDLNRERGDSSGRQQFVERSIANRVFTIDRQVGIQLRGHLFENTAADMRYYAGVFNGEGRGVRNNDNGMLYMGRLQWNFLGRDLPWRQTDVEFTELPTGSIAIAGATNTGSCTRWSSSGCGNLDGFESPARAATNQFEIDQFVEEIAFKYRGFSFQQEYHKKSISDRVVGSKNDLTGGYVQAGYFFSNLFPSFPAPLELAVRYANVNEPNAVDRRIDNEREEYTLGANWFFNGHNNKLTLDYSHLTLDDGLLGLDDSENRVRLQWDVSF